MGVVLLVYKTKEWSLALEFKLERALQNVQRGQGAPVLVRSVLCDLA